MIATYAALAQLKLLTTAVFAVILLRKQLYPYQWRALVLLFVGVVMVQQQQQQQQADSSRDAWVGTLAVVGMAGCSGLAGVYVENVLKARDSQFDLWDRNIQLSLYGLLFAVLSIALTPSEQRHFASHSFFYGYSWLTHVVIALGSVGGLLVATVTLYLDNIMKNFASVASIVLTCLTSALVLHERQIEAQFVCGVVAVGLAMLNYTDPTAAAALAAAAASSADITLQTTDNGQSASIKSNSGKGSVQAETLSVSSEQQYMQVAADDADDVQLLSEVEDAGEVDGVREDETHYTQLAMTDEVELQGELLKPDDTVTAVASLSALRPLDLIQLPEV